MLIILGFIIGTILGSFIKTLADRSLEEKSLNGRSRCPNCKHKLSVVDLIPLVSFIFLQGRCRYCHKSISWQYPIIEIVMGALVAYLFWQNAPAVLYFSVTNSWWVLGLQLLFKIFLISALVTLAITDLKQMLIPDRIVLPAIFITLIYLLILGGYNSIAISYPGAIQSLTPYLLSAVSIWLFFMAIILVTRGRGMGGGDSKLGALIGLSLGFPLSLLAIMLAFFLGAGVALILVATGKRHFGQTLPFGPFLVAGTLIALFWGSTILDWYLKLSF